MMLNYAKYHSVSIEIIATFLYSEFILYYIVFKYIFEMKSTHKWTYIKEKQSFYNKGWAFHF